MTSMCACVMTYILKIKIMLVNFIVVRSHRFCTAAEVHLAIVVVFLFKEHEVLQVEHREKD